MHLQCVCIQACHLVVTDASIALARTRGFCIDREVVQACAVPPSSNGFCLRPACLLMKTVCMLHICGQAGRASLMYEIKPMTSQSAQYISFVQKRLMQSEILYSQHLYSLTGMSKLENAGSDTARP